MGPRPFHVFLGFHALCSQEGIFIQVSASNDVQALVSCGLRLRKNIATQVSYVGQVTSPQIIVAAVTVPGLLFSENEGNISFHFFLSGT